MNVLLSGFYPNYRYGLAIYALRSYLLRDPRIARGGRVEAEGFPLAMHEGEAAALILRRKPDLVGFSCYVWSVEKVLGVSARLRDAGFRGPIVLGGPEATFTAARLLEENPAITAVVRGEGEETLRELALRCLDSSGDLDGVAGLALRKDGRVVLTPERPLISDLGRLPSPYTDASVDLQADDIMYGLGAYESYRGCIFECSFCLWGKTTNTRFRGIAQVERELRAIMGSRVRRVWVADAVANLDKERFKRILRLLARENPNKVLFDFEIVAQMLDEETIELLAELPGGYIACGLQSTDPGVLKATRRFSNLERFRRNIESLRRRGGKLEVYIDLIYGLPGETWESYRQAVDFAFGLLPDRLQVHQLRALPGTEFFQQAARLGLEHDDRPPYFVRRTPTFSPEDFGRGQRLGRVVELYNHLPPVKLAVAVLARSGAGRPLPLLEELAAPLGELDRDRVTLADLADAFEAFIVGRRRDLGAPAAAALNELGRYYIRGLMPNTVRPASAGFSLGVQKVGYDFSSLLADPAPLARDVDWAALAAQPAAMAFNEDGLKEPFARFLLTHESFRPTLPP